MEIKEIVRKYFEAKQQEKETKKSLAELGEKLRKYLVDNGSYEDTNYKAYLSTKVKEVQDQEKMVEVANKNKYEFILDTIQVVNTDKLIEAVYNEKVDMTKFADCITEQETLALYVRKQSKKDE